MGRKRRENRQQQRELKKRQKRTEKKASKARPRPAAQPAGNRRCGLCGRTDQLIRTECCGNWICDDEHLYVPFSFDRNSCSRNHRRFTLCGFHHSEEHGGRWQECGVCRADQETEMYVWLGTNEFNFEKLENPPAFEPTRCATCGATIRLGDGGYSARGGDYWCERCTLLRHPGLAPREDDLAPILELPLRTRRKRRKPSNRPGATPLDLPRGKPAEFVVLSAGAETARCRLPGADTELTLRAPRCWLLVPGEFVTVNPRKSWIFGSHPFVSGEIVGWRLDVAALGLEPLALAPMGSWDPEDEFHCDEGEQREDWAAPIVAMGPRPMFEMEQIFPGRTREDLFDGDDPILEAIDLFHTTACDAANRMLMDLLAEDLRCLDAHAHLGNFALHWDLEQAGRHYEAGVRIAELSLGDDFTGVLPWGLIDNRPFLRCLHGLGLTLWRQERYRAAEEVLERLLRLNPTDNQGARLILPEVRADLPWREEEEEEEVLPPGSW